MNFEDVKRMWEKDSIIDPSELDKEALKIPQLHSKYSNLLYDFKLKQDKSESELKKVIKELWEYYSGKSENPYPVKLLKQDIPMHMESDEKYINASLTFKYYSNLVNYIKDILTCINNRSFQIKNSIDWQRFMNGLN